MLGFGGPVLHIDNDTIGSLKGLFTSNKLSLKKKKVEKTIYFFISFNRYKMISTYTWPNFRGDSDKEAVRVLLESINFHNDVKYGKTKVFIRSPKTLFALEKVCIGKKFFFSFWLKEYSDFFLVQYSSSTYSYTN